MSFNLLGYDLSAPGWAGQWLSQISLASSSSDQCYPANLDIPDIPGIEILTVQAFEQRNYTYTPGILAAALTEEARRPVTGLNFCNITVTYTHPGWNDQINLNIRLPTAKDGDRKNHKHAWNGRFTGIGGGALVTGNGAVGESQLMPFMIEGYACATTDGGHTSDLFGPELFDPQWALTSPGNVNWPLLQDFASVSLHDLAVIGKAVTERFYGEPPKYSYWFGGSTGGRQGHMFAQRYPKDFNGIIALFPAFNWDKFFFSHFWPTFVMNQMGYYPKPCEFEAITKKAVEACDGIDGVVDGIISREDLCDFKAMDVVGQGYTCGEGDEVIITAQAAEVVEKAWEGPRGVNGEFQWYGYGRAVDLRDPTTASIQIKCDDENDRTSCRSETNNVWARYWVAKDPMIDMRALTHEQWDDMVHASTNEYVSVIGTSDPDLSAFKRAGGKMVFWHGTADAVIPFNGSVNYYDRVLERDPEAKDFYRFFTAPGVGHCFHCHGASPPPEIQTVVDWVEKGIAPETMRGVGTNGLGQWIERDLCLYPKVQHHLGGDPMVPESFTCV